MPESSRLATEIATTLRRERESRRITQQQLADRAGTSQSAVARFERGGRVPAIPLLERLFAALDLQLAVTVEELDSPPRRAAGRPRRPATRRPDRRAEPGPPAGPAG
ncbi:helix-turn-helix domain-containing protein [Micromonospora sp. NPDC092111]|uniref:helix-turn-helix domain-containing protein n=1 Tax=Micromonospora sp. NPDC092111 TaxID=3364289 RepID=UPI0038170616